MRSQFFGTYYRSGLGKIAIALTIIFTSGCYSTPFSQASPMSSSSQQSPTPQLAGIQPNNRLDRPAELALPQTENYYSQGIRGQVQVLKGNHMPTNSPLPEKHSPNGIPIRLWVFAGKVQPVAGPRLPISTAKQLDNWEGWTVSDRNGQFEMGLPTGEYTILAEQGQYLYLNSFLGDGSFASTQVLQGQITEIQIVNNENATF